jgi:hypothetical protein|tara:strand:- start:2206 stop:2733 length:528 start_codon:yes stop_codon:yes gene_type:complete
MPEPDDPRFGAQFGLSSEDESKMAGDALGAHLWEGMEQAMFGYVGGYRDHKVRAAWETVGDHWFDEHQAGNVRPRRSIEEDPDDPDEYPTFHHDLGGGYRAEFPIDGVYATIFHGDNPLEVVNFTDAAYIQGPDNQEEDKRRAMEDRRNPTSVVQQIEAVHNETILPNEEGYRGW